MEYENLSKKFRRYSLEDLVGFCCYHSSQFMKGLENKYGPNTAWPWLLDAFALFAIKYGGENIIQNGYDEKLFTKMYVTIMDHLSKFFEQKSDEYNSTDFFYLSEFGLQKKYQNHKTKLYRHYLLFNDPDFKKIYLNLYQNDYIDYLSLAFNFTAVFELLKTEEVALKPHKYLDICNYTYSKYADLIKISGTSISRSDFIEYYVKNNITDDDYKYCFNILWWQPFITVDKNVYTPCPFHIIDALTTSFVFKLTDGDDEKRTSFGKPFQNYVFNLISKSEQFDEVIDEYEYGKSQNTSDALTRYGNNYILFEIKAYTPRINTQLGKQQDIKYSIDRLAEIIEQLYKHLKFKFQVEYWFNNEVHEAPAPEINKWGIAIINEDLFIDREKIYKAAATNLKISLDSEEYKFLVEHILIANIDEFEKCCIFGESIFNKIKKRYDSKEFFSFFEYEQHKDLNNENYKNYNKLFEKLKNNYENFKCELLANNLLSN